MMRARILAVFAQNADWWSDIIRNILHVGVAIVNRNVVPVGFLRISVNRRCTGRQRTPAETV